MRVVFAANVLVSNQGLETDYTSRARCELLFKKHRFF